MKHQVMIFIVALPLLVVATMLPNIAHAAESQTSADINFILHTQAGLTAYTTLTSTVSLEHARQLFTIIDIDTESEEFIHGEYLLAGRNEMVMLAIGHAGWIIAYHPPGYASQHLLDCHDSFDVNKIVGRPEQAVIEIADSLGFAEPAVSFYDFRNPEASNIALHWLYTAHSGSVSSDITLPISNIYMERGYAYCTALSNSNFWLNSQLVDGQSGVSSVIRRWGSLGADQLRAGQTNVMEIQAISLFGTGFLAGVSTVYSGTAPITTNGGYSRTLTLDYPAMFGEPLNISHTYLPLLQSPD